MARFAKAFSLAALAITLCLLSGSSTLAARSASRRSFAFERDGAKLELDEQGQLVGDELYNEHGELAKNPTIRFSSHLTSSNSTNSAAKKRQSTGFNYATDKVRGVNIGGWLVTEPWIKPSLYDNTGDDRVVDEWTFGKYVSDVGSRLENHFATFYTQSDFNDIAAAGLNHVRIPIGYWALDKGSSPYYKGSQYSRLKDAIGWARNAGLKVVVDLHGAPGSQNGFDNSGLRGVVHWFSKESYKNRAKEVIRTFASDFRDDQDVVTAIELLNEPLTTSGPSNALSFYNDYVNNGYYTVRYPSGSNQNTGVDVMVHDGFQSLSYWNGKLQPPTYEGVILDTHIYSVFNQQQIQLSNNDRLQYFCNLKGSIASANNNLYTVVGEWTNAPTDCAKYLNGRGVGARYDGTYPGSSRVGSCNGKTGRASTFSDDYKYFLKQMFDTQRKVYEGSGTGYIFWTWKNEQAHDWSYKAGLHYGWITRNLDSFSAAAC